MVLTASAVGSGPGCQPFGWGAGFCALRPQFDDTLDDVLHDWHPSLAGTASRASNSLTPWRRRHTTTDTRSGIVAINSSAAWRIPSTSWWK